MTAVGWRESNGTAVVFAGLARPSAGANATGNSNSAAVLRCQFPISASLHAPAVLGTSESSIGPMALADVDGDGDLDLFVGGRFRPGRWPEPAESALYFQQDNGSWRREAATSNLFASIGLVSGAVFTDLDADGDPDLVLTRDWGAIVVFTNTRGQFIQADWKLTFPANAEPSTEIDRLSQLTGWWTGIASGDFDGDGRLDLVAGNLGRNSAYERFRSKPLRIYFGDFAGDHGVDILECGFDAVLGKYAPLHDVWTLSRTLPWLLARFDSYEKFARVGIEEALGDHFPAARFIEAGWADSTVFLNRGDHFEVRRLPREAQVAPAFAVCVADFDGDAKEDLFLSQNFFAVRPDATRQDAGRGLLLRGDGQGGFAAMPAWQSGVMIHGEQRGAAIADYDRDGRPDLVIRQYGGQTRLLRNAGGRVARRIQLRGPPGNPQAIGTVLRAGAAGNWGPAREIHAGSGYWSQDSATTVLAVPPGATKLQLRWPGGKMSEIPLDAAATDISVVQP